MRTVDIIFMSNYNKSLGRPTSLALRTSSAFPAKVTLYFLFPWVAFFGTWPEVICDPLVSQIVSQIVSTVAWLFGLCQDCRLRDGHFDMQLGLECLQDSVD